MSRVLRILRWFRVTETGGVLLAFVPWSLWVLSVAFQLGVWVGVLTLQPDPSWPWPTYPVLTFSLAFLALGAVGAVVISKAPANALGWLFCFSCLLESLATAGRVYVVGFELPGREFVALAASLAGNVSGFALAWSVLLFPNGRLPSAAWRPIAWVVFGAAGGYTLMQTLHPGPLLAFVGIDNPLGISSAVGEVLRLVPDIEAQLLAAALGLATLTVVVRFRRASGLERQQMKWFAFAAVLLVGAFAVMLVYDWDTGVLLFGVGLTALPLAMGIGILRYQLYDIDLLINRTLVYGSVTAVLAGLFAALSILTQRLILAVTGQESQVAVVLAALVVTVLFQPLRAHVQVVVDRRFYRRKYDATQTLERFASQLRDEVELDQLTARLVAVVRETMQPSHASLWLQPSKDRKPSVDRP